jgi:D-alanyl-D-alanine carboxypeptidase (penicillin-binding protein 5/6)
MPWFSPRNKRRGSAFCAFALWCVACAAVSAVEPVIVPAPPAVAAKSWIVMDFDSGRVLAESASSERVEPASLTKIMLAYVAAGEIAAGRIALTDMVTVSEKAWKMEGSKMFIEVGKQVSVDDLMKGVVIQSGNDASVALAEHVSGSEEVFVSLMNEHARRLGLTGTHFTNAAGLPDPEHYTTARDLALLSIGLIRDYPQEYALHALRDFTFNNIVQQNRNELLGRDPSVDGIKTGHTESAGFCLVASALRDGMRVVSVVMGTDSPKTRTTATEALLGYAFRFYETRLLAAPDETLATERVWKGVAEQVNLGIARAVHVTVPRGAFDRLERKVDVKTPLLAPIAAGATLGLYRVTLNGEEIATPPLVARDAVAAGSLFRRMTDGVRLFLQ